MGSNARDGVRPETRDHSDAGRRSEQEAQGLNQNARHHSVGALEPLHLYSGIRSTLKRKVLLRGTPIAVVGMLIWIYAGTQLPEPVLSAWGFLIFLVGGGLIFFGMLPYRRLSELEARPHEIISDKQHIHFADKGRLKLSLPYKGIKKITYHDDGSLYGIALDLNTSNTGSTITGQERTRRRYGCDLFLPYFSQRAFAKLKRDLEGSD